MWFFLRGVWPFARRILLQMSTLFPVRFGSYLPAATSAGLLLYLVALILTAFLLFAVLVQNCLPLVGRVARKLPRWLAASIVRGSKGRGSFSRSVRCSKGMVVTPWRVGNRIGLKPIAVLFALVVFGKLFGFFGVLLALPASAALLGALRHRRERYSDRYKSR